MSVNWPNSFVVHKDDHMEHQSFLVEEADNDDRESALYHAIDWGLNFNALRTTVEGKRISVHPQAELELPDRVLRSRTIRLGRQLQQDMSRLSINPNDDDHLRLTEDGSASNRRISFDGGSDDPSLTDEAGSISDDLGFYRAEDSESASDEEGDDDDDDSYTEKAGNHDSDDGDSSRTAKAGNASDYGDDSDESYAEKVGGSDEDYDNDDSGTQKAGGSRIDDDDDGAGSCLEEPMTSCHDDASCLQEESFPEFDNLDTISARLTESGSSAPTVDVPPKSKHRRPDFITLITFPDKHQRVLFIHEVKPLDVLLYAASRDKNLLRDQVSLAFRDLLPQIVQQAQFGFSHYPGENVLYIMGMVQFYFCVYRFYRGRTPEYGDPLPNDLHKIPEMRKGPYSLFNKTQSDYHSRFKYWWTRVKNDAS
ncbi:hypothetical protein BKA93DRAFT_752268 [Sparassis latifolia]